MINQGTYRIYSRIHNNGEPEKLLIGRFMVKNKAIQFLEDHDQLLSNSLTEGPMTDQHERFFKLLHHSPYFEVIPEQQINQGIHDDLIDDANWDDVQPEARYLLIGNDDEPKRMETYGDSIVLDGNQLSDDQTKSLMEEVRSGRYRMVPV